MARVGDKLGRYELLEQLGKGAAGTVFRARDSLLGIDVCVKILHSGLSTQPGIVERFKRELLLARRVAHPGICKIFDIQEADGTHFLTMEYVKGETLSTRLNRDGRMPVPDAVRLMRKVSEALGAAHKAGVVHRDVKPGNIIIGEGERVTIVDFGVATAEDLERLTRAGVVLGSRSYMAPETWQGRPATAAGDVWALGVILYGCVTGRLPYKGEGVVGVFEAIKTTKPILPSAINPDVTPALEQLIFKAMCIDLEQRFEDASAVEAALATLELTLGDDAAPTAVRPPAFAAHADERLHRPSAQPLPRPSSVELPPTREVSRTAPQTGERSDGLSDEMSLYAPGDPARSGLGSAEQEATKVIGPFPGLAGDSLLNADNVADAFDAAFGLDDTAAKATDVHEQPLVLAPEPAPDSGLLGDELGDEGFRDDKTALVESLSEAPLSLFPPSAEEPLSLAPHDTVLVTPLPDPTEEAAVLGDDALLSPPAAAFELAAPAKRSGRPLAAALAMVALALVATLAFLFGGAEGEAKGEHVVVADAAVASAAAAVAPPPVEAPADPPPLEAAAASAPGDEAADAGGGALAAPAGDAGAEAEALAEGSAEEGSAEEGSAEEDVAADELASEDAAPEDDSAPPEPLVAAAVDDEPAPPAEVRSRKQRASPQAAARAKYNRKRAALNAALARKGVLVGDVPAVDDKRRQMSQATKRRDYARAADAADDAVRELAKVKIDASFVGKKLSRFNQGYDRTSDESVRAKLTGMIKDVGSDYSKGRYEEANKKLNRAFSLMRQER